jgi:hypothetical protein
MSKPTNNLLWKYAGLATQFMVAIGIAVYAGLQTDKWLKLKMPLTVWVLPLLVIVAMIVKIIKDTAQKK